MRIAVTGQTGQVATCLRERAAEFADIDLIQIARSDLDLARPQTIAPAIASVRPDIIVNAGAYTAVDKAETEPDLAFAINAAGPEALALAAADLGIPIIQISTDFVFDGSKPDPYIETDPPNPLSAYGASKLAGETAVAGANGRHLIVRTAWVYSAYGGNFVKSILAAAATRDELEVVCDQCGNPTSADDLAAALIVMARLALEAGFSGWGIYNVAGTGWADRAALARQVLAESVRRGGPGATVKPITSEKLKAPAARPANSRLDPAKFEREFGFVLSDWRESVAKVVERLVSEGRLHS